MRTLRFTALFLLLSTPALAQPHRRSEPLYLSTMTCCKGSALSKQPADSHSNTHAIRRLDSATH